MQLIRTRLRAAPRRIAANAAVCLALVMSAIMLVSAPALADAGTGLSQIAGHTCQGSPPNQAIREVLCIEIGIYVTSSGESFVTSQVEAICENSGGVVEGCASAAVAGEVANGSGGSSGGSGSCDGNCESGGLRNYFDPLGGFPISVGTCDDNVWGVVEVGSNVIGEDGSFISVVANIGTAHFNVCEPSSGQFTFS